VIERCRTFNLSLNQGEITMGELKHGPPQSSLNAEYTNFLPLGVPTSAKTAVAGESPI
jgi:hypothetical protein